MATCTSEASDGRHPRPNHRAPPSSARPTRLSRRRRRRRAAQKKRRHPLGISPTHGLKLRSPTTTQPLTRLPLNPASAKGHPSSVTASIDSSNRTHDCRESMDSRTGRALPTRTPLPPKGANGIRVIPRTSCEPVTEQPDDRYKDVTEPPGCTQKNWNNTPMWSPTREFKNPSPNCPDWRQRQRSRLLPK